MIVTKGYGNNKIVLPNPKPTFQVAKEMEAHKPRKFIFRERRGRHFKGERL